MSKPSPRRMDRNTAERLLDGDPVALSRAGRLAVPLRAVRGPVQPDELAGEQAALAAFVAAADLAPRPRRRSGSGLRIALAELLTVKVAAVVAAGLGGVALAAGTGALPNPLVGPATPLASDPPANHAPASHDPTSPATSGGPPTRPNASTDPAGSPAPSLVGLCRAYAAGPADNRGRTLENPAFAELVEAAGGVDQVAGYCTDIAATDTGRPSDAPAGVGRPSLRPTPATGGGTPTSRPDAPATRRPGGVPTGTGPAAPTGRVPAATPNPPGR